MKPVKTDVHFPTLEKEILAFWKANGIVEKNLKANAGKKPFVFYDGPPFATGLPHYGHILAGTLKDIVPRYWVMKGRHVQRRWGWDCHGLPVEFEMEKELGLQGLHDIEKFGIAKFNEACRGIVLRYTAEWEKTIARTGRWADFKNAYRTMDPAYMETVWWVVRQLWEKGLIYEGYRVMPYSWRISTPLSNFEAHLNYKEVQDPAITVRLRCLGRNRYYLAWTTTPWTLPSNLALAVGKDIEYMEVEEKATGDRYVLATARVKHYFKDESQFRLLETFPGSALEGELYEPLFPYFETKIKQGAFKVVLGHHVTTEDGTGIVHMAPAFGEDDFIVCQKYGVPIVNPVDAEGNFSAEVPDYQGQNVKEADRAIIRDLKAKGALFRHETINHNYPFCWRSDTPLIYRAISTWFVKVESLKDRIIASNAKTHWVPEHLRDGRFGKWLESARDWNISRNRFWGTPIPIWRCECGAMECIGSVKELEEKTGAKVTDLHKHFVDELTYPCPKCHKPMRRIPEVLDCWFESGSMPYGQAHYPFENRDDFESRFPANFIAEGLDQTRGWFYTLSVLGNALFGRAPFENVVVNGLVLAEDGKKMSKRLKNYPEPSYVLDTYGADAMRAYLTTSPAARGEELRFSENGIREIVRSVLLPYWNAYSFFVTYAIADGWDPSRHDAKRLGALENDLDKWVVSRLHSLIQGVEAKMAVYHVDEVIPLVLGFIDELTNWYIRLNRRRFWKEQKGTDKDDAYATLYHVLTHFTRVLAPILPFVTEEIHRNLRLPSDAESVHLASFPELEAKRIDKKLEAQMALVQSAVSIGRHLRNVHKLKTRQPLRRMSVITRNEDLAGTMQRFDRLLMSELNVNQVEYSQDEAAWVNLSVKPNARAIGPRVGKKMPAIMARIKQLGAKEIDRLQKGESLEIEGEAITAADVVVERSPKKEGVIETVGDLTVWLDPTLDQELLDSGLAREFINRVQKLRKDVGLNVSDRIRLKYHCPAELSQAVAKHVEYIKQETLAVDLAASASASWQVEHEIDDLSLKLHLEKV